MEIQNRVPESLSRPSRKRTSSIILHRIKIGDSVDDVEEFFTTDPEGVATVTVGNLQDRLSSIRDWRSYGVPEWAKRSAYVPYHYIIARNGEVIQYLPYDARGSHTAGVNSTSIGVGTFGDFRRSNPTAHQILSAKYLCRDLMFKNESIKNVYGHDEIISMRNKKAKNCPGPNYPLDEVASWAKNAVKAMRSERRF
jgi:hypothetical protein